MGKYNIGTYLQCTRKAAGLTHPEACDLPNGEQICTIESLSRIENGKRRPHPYTLNCLLNRYGKQKIFGNSYLKTTEYEVLILDKQLNIMMAEFRYDDAKRILKQIEERLSTKFLTNRQYLATNYAMLAIASGEITPNEAIEFFTEIVRMTLPVFGTKNFTKAFISQREAIIILQIGNAYGKIGNYKKAIEILEETYANLTRYPEKFHYADGLYAIYGRAIIKWKGEAGRIREALEQGEQEIQRAFQTGYMDTLPGLIYAKSYNMDKMFAPEEKTPEKRSEINSGYEIAALISELFGEKDMSDFARKKIQ